MSILIKGIDMPEDIDELRLIINGMSIAIEPTQAIQIPTPHGRLIDADKIDYDEFWHREGQGFTIAVCQGAEQIIKEQPTILDKERE